MSKQFTKEFKEDAVRYYHEHKDLGYELCSKNLGISRSALCTWVKNAKDNKAKYLQGALVIIKVMRQRKMPNCVRN